MRYLFSVFLKCLLICLYSCSGEIQTENKLVIIDAYYDDKRKEYCPLPGLVGGIERGPTAEGDDKVILIRQCFINDKGWLTKVVYYDFNNCRSPNCAYVKLYYNYYEEGLKYKVCTFFWNKEKEYWEKEEPCKIFKIEL